MKNNILVGVVVGIVVLVGAYFVLPRVQTVVQQVVGSGSSPSVIDGCMEVDGVTTCYSRQALQSATSTPCAIRTPAATSTYITTLQVQTATSAALTWAVSTTTAAQGYSTTTPTYTYLIPANLQASLVVSPTLIQSNVAAPNSWLTWSVYGLGTGGTGGSLGAGVVTGGYCGATFRLF